MTKEIEYIEKVEIKGLWNKFDIEWHLNKDVNILAGGNGSGKSTILIGIYNVLVGIFPNNNNIFKMEKIKVFFDDGCHKLGFEFKNNIEAFEKEASTDTDYKAVIAQIQKIQKLQENNELVSFSEGISLRFFASGLGTVYNDISKIINIDFISTFNTELKSSEDIKKLSDNNVKTDLDWEIYKLQIQYKDYQLNIGKRKDIIIDESKNPKKEITKIRKPQNDFLGMIDACFAETNKKINREKNEISFLIDDTEITAYQLSSGEKQLLIILLKTLIQNNRQSILFLDEPEISLHIDWQKRLIGFIKQLNPNVQIIMATHSPAMIMNGWLDKVFNVSDLIVPKSKL